MKPIIPFALLGALLAVGAANAAVTDPVGYISHTVAGNVAALPTGADTYLGPVLTNSIDFAGQTTVDPSGLTTLTFAGGVPEDLNSASYLEITSETQEGWWSQIVSSTATTIVINDAVPTVGGNVSVAIRRITTIQDFLGANAPGLADDSGTPDEVIIVDPVTQAAKTVVYTLTNGPVEPATWVDFVTYEDESDYPLFPGTGVIIRNYSAGEKTFTSVGDVKTGKTQVDVLLGDNFIAPPYAVGNSFNQMDLATQLLDQSDEVITLNAAQAATTYYSYDDGSTTEMVDFVTYEPKGTVEIKEGTGMIVRRPAGSPSTITFPAQVIAE
ncbi:hypothetical protein [Luteolibacter marinus]|uniref:hypothetical protein n=1 Tax=Luteolibacter marinus TaxID=2776705 RepID=UPI00186969B1|nr:hypothetical protein [Luteolibacter marinus]